MAGRISSEVVFAVAEEDPIWKCKRCGRDFRVMKNVAQYSCIFHGSSFSYGENYYPCCGKAKGTKGCTRDDHIDTMYFPVNDDGNTVFADPDVVKKVFELFVAIPESAGTIQGRTLIVRRHPQLNPDPPSAV